MLIFRGKCEVFFVKDFRSLDGCDLQKSDSFFSCLAYNQESSRLASVQGEIRVGGAFQVRVIFGLAGCSPQERPWRPHHVCGWPVRSINNNPHSSLPAQRFFYEGRIVKERLLRPGGTDCKTDSETERVRKGP